MTATQLKSYITTQLAVPLVLVSKLKDALFAMVDFTTSSVASIIPDWTSAITFDTTGPNIYCTYLDSSGYKKLWQTKTNGNINNQPPTAPATHENAYWLEVSASASAAIPEWAPGLYGPGLIIVFHNHSVDGRGLYVLLEPVRPYNSANIETEITAVKWELISGSGGGENLSATLTIGNDAGGLQIVNLANPTNAQDADTKGARDTAITAATTALKGGVPSGGDTLNKLYNLIVALGELVGGWNTASLPTTGSGASSAIDKGDYWRITGTITITGIGDLKSGDMLIASVANASVAADFFAVQNNVDIATSSVLGLIKLYSNLSASNTDGSPSQSAVVAGIAASVTPVSSQTVAGKVEEATSNEVRDGAASGGTGAPLIVTPDKLLAKLAINRTLAIAGATVQTDNQGTVYFNSPTPINFTIDLLSQGTIINMININLGVVTFVNGSGVTFDGIASLQAAVSGGKKPSAQIRYNVAATPMILSGGSDAVWGAITGSLSAQTDLVAELARIENLIGTSDLGGSM